MNEDWFIETEVVDAPPILLHAGALIEWDDYGFLLLAPAV